jgi:hypothetical protein
MFIVPAQTQWTRVQRLSPEKKGVSSYIPLQAGYRSKKQSTTHIRLHVTPLAISFPQCYVTFFTFQFFKFYLSALPSPPPVSSSEHQPVCFFSGFPFLATLFPPLMLGHTQGQRPSPWSRGLYFHGIYNGLHNSPGRPQHQGSQTEQY